MNLQWTYMILTFLIFVKLKSTNANRPKFKRGGLDLTVRSDTRSHRYKNLDLPQQNYYNKLLNRPYYKRHSFKYLNNKKHIDVKPFVDLTRDDFPTPATNQDKIDKFSQDYVDISDIARDSNDIMLYKLKPEQNKDILIDIHGNTYQILKQLDRGGRRMIPYQKRSNAYQSDSDDSSTTSDEEEKPKKSTRISKKKIHSGYIPKRFQIINNKSEESDDDDDEEDSEKIEINTSGDTSSNVESDEEIKVDSESQSKEDSSDGLMYIQSPTRHVRTIDVEWRRRLKHFLPKRVHWDEREFQNLRNYWIDGPKGRYPTQYKTPY